MAKYAVLVIDMLKDFIHGSLRFERALHIIPNIKELLRIARSCKVPVIYVNDSHVGVIDREFILWGPHAVRGSEGSEVIDELRPTEGDFIVMKRRYSGFFETDLDILLRELGADTVILTGVHTHICVMHTAADAFFRGYNVVVVKDCVEALTEEYHRLGLEYMEKFYGAKLMSSDEVVGLISMKG